MPTTLVSWIHHTVSYPSTLAHVLLCLGEQFLLCLPVHSLFIFYNRFSSSVLFPTRCWVAMQGGLRAFSNQVFSLPLHSVFHYYPSLRITMEASIVCLVINGALVGTHHVSVVTLHYARWVVVISMGPSQLCDVVGEVSYCLCLQSLSKRGHKNGFTLFW